MREEEAFAVFRQILSAVKHIYNHGFLYRDINAGNVILQERACLIDFGLTLPIEEAARETPADVIWGTDSFIFPR